ncbi:4-(cytidine 5'-diphospho)-2-C-methyl-D-erythritol kinase [Marinigracilibium pacificum]|uniref:4-diphosphocytidyl-2-C-methyl-D-erythritol kinase n=1 Tax=Marinigracilibium pacificum TaxID=2729599 RepID=A0A848J3S3_9BACT|nr:4-(cytidine 5'-diphospho)-2-C-methyl-D-erythritol kinase [Marinigracilibium pacificum]NMM49134.1 4-(cytidine 5'-diphospho)-2-C-methyl-D-erythritol kinase [Marinigracilibium pacificum]
MISFPNAKINLGLFVTGKRKDGFHNIESIFFPIPFCDILEINHSSKTTFESSGLNIPGKKEENLIFKAYKAFRKDFNLDPVQIILHKQIPMGAGLGGGSADGAFTLRMLNDLFDLYLEDDLIEVYASDLGSDCPFFVSNKPAFVSGRGENIEHIDLSLEGYYLVLMNPGIHISTPKAYSLITPEKIDFSLKELVKEKPENWKGRLTNSFETPIVKEYPIIGEAINHLYEQNAIYASMTGSGSSIYGLFQSKPEIHKFNEFVVWEGKL